MNNETDHVEQLKIAVYRGELAKQRTRENAWRTQQIEEGDKARKKLTELGATYESITPDDYGYPRPSTTYVNPPGFWGKLIALKKLKQGEH